MIDDINLTNVIRHRDVYFFYMKGKQIRKLSRQSQELVIKFLECIDSNVDSSITSKSIESKKYFVLFINKASRAC